MNKRIYIDNTLGHLTLASDLSPKEITVNSDSDIATRVDQFYDSFKVIFFFTFNIFRILLTNS